MKSILQSKAVDQRLEPLKIVRLIRKVASNSYKVRIRMVSQYQARCLYQDLLSLPMRDTTHHSHKWSVFWHSQLFPEPDARPAIIAGSHGYGVIDHHCFFR